MKKSIEVQGKILVVSIDDNGGYYAPQWIEAHNGNISYANFTAMIGFENPLAALKQIGREIIEMSRGLDKPVYFIGSTDKRTRVYAKLLKQCGFAFEFVNEPNDGELAINLLF